MVGEETKTESKKIETVTITEIEAPKPPPDGGYGWVVLIAAFVRLLF